MRPSEDDLIARYLAPLAGPGGLGLRDDAALVTPRPGHDLVVTKDMLVAGVHFFADDPAEAIARKALRVNLSDLAAKGAAPVGFLLGLGFPDEWTSDWLAAFADALGEDAAHFGCPLLGGDTVKSPVLTLSITAFGEVATGAMVPRTGTRPGNVIYVSGTIGDAALGLCVRRADPADMPWIKALDPDAKAWLHDRYLLPRPRLGLRAALVASASAAMDVSDGFVGDLAKMLREAGVSMTVACTDVPLSSAVRAAVAHSPSLLDKALTGGDDYEILCAIPPENAEAFEAAVGLMAIPLTRIGVVVPGHHEPRFFDAAGDRVTFATPSFRHF